MLGKALQAYVAAGIRSDHEAYTVEEGRERLRAGMWLLIREASAARNLHALLPLVAEYGPGRIAFCTDDREPEHIVSEGHLNSMVRAAVVAGTDPRDALVMASHSAATWHGLGDRGAVAPGYRADLLLLPDLRDFRPALVLKAGSPVADLAAPAVPDWVRNTVRVATLTSGDLRIAWDDGGRMRVIGVLPGQIVTEALVEEPLVVDGAALRRSGARPGQDRGDRAPPRHRPDRARLRPRLRPASAARSPRPWRTMPTTSWWQASTTMTWCARHAAWPSLAAGWWPSTTGECVRSWRCRLPASCPPPRPSRWWPKVAPWPMPPARSAARFTPRSTRSGSWRSR